MIRGWLEMDSIQWGEFEMTLFTWASDHFQQGTEFSYRCETGLCHSPCLWFVLVAVHFTSGVLLSTCTVNWLNKNQSKVVGSTQKHLLTRWRGIHWNSCWLMLERSPTVDYWSFFSPLLEGVYEKRIKLIVLLYLLVPIVDYMYFVFVFVCVFCVYGVYMYSVFCRI